MQAKVRGKDAAHEWRRYSSSHKLGTYSRPISFHWTSKGDWEPCKSLRCGRENWCGSLRLSSQCIIQRAKDFLERWTECLFFDPGICWSRGYCCPPPQKASQPSLGLCMFHWPSPVSTSQIWGNMHVTTRQTYVAGTSQTPHPVFGHWIGTFRNCLMSC